MSRPYVNAYINNLQRQIAEAATRLIYQKSVQKDGEDTFHQKEVSYVPSKIETRKYELIQSESAYALINQRLPFSSSYASASYMSTDKILIKSTVVEGFVFDNNKEFDFKV